MKYAVLIAAILMLLAVNMPMQPPAPSGPSSYDQMNAAKSAHEYLPANSTVANTTIIIHYAANVSFIFRHADGSIYYNVTTHNIMVNGGANSLTDAIGTGSTTAWGYIEPTNASMAPSVTDTYCCGGSDKTFVTNTDLDAQTAAYTDTGTGTCTLDATFTLTTTVTVTVYGSGLTTSSAHGAAANNLRAEADLPSTAPLTTAGDYVKIIWAITITT